MAPGVKKTYRSLYAQNLAKAVSFLHDGEDGEKRVTEILSRIEAGKGLSPSMEEDGPYLEEEKKNLENFLTGEEVRKVQRYAKKYADKEIRRATYQAMEALIHNLNTMHSRAGAQIPFSSINYGTDTSPEGRLVMESVLKATEAGLGGGETPIFPIHIFKVKEGVNYNPGDPNYDLFKLGMPGVGEAAFSEFFLSGCAV